MARHLFTILTAISLAVCAYSIGLLVYRAAGKKPSPESAKVIQAASDTLNAFEDRRMNGEALTPQFVELLCTWSRRLAIAQRDAVTDPAIRQAALQAHLKRMRIFPIYRSEQPYGPISQVQVEQANYYLADAEALLADETNHLLPPPLKLLVYSLVVPIAQLVWIAARGIFRRRRPGLCVSCGYDLRATPGRCPECGMVPSMAVKA